MSTIVYERKSINSKHNQKASIVIYQESKDVSLETEEEGTQSSSALNGKSENLTFSENNIQGMYQKDVIKENLLKEEQDKFNKIPPINNGNKRSLLTQNMTSLTEEDNKKESKCLLSLNDFELLAVVGEGAYGKVFQVRLKNNDNIYAMKVMRKTKLIKENHIEYVLEERNILKEIDHPYIVKLHYCFQTKKKLYMIFDFISGGQLFYQLFKKGCFSYDEIRVYGAEIVSAISYLHSKGIIHRDMKPENILLDNTGHIKITDFGLSKSNMDDSETHADSFVGTLHYMAPEIIKGEKQTKAIDWWSLGILLYEMCTGDPPFDYPKQKKKKKKDIESDRKYLMNQIKNKLPEKPICTEELWNLIRRLLEKDPEKRLGTKNIREIKNHPFFKSINWLEIDQGKFKSQSSNTINKNFRCNIDKKYLKKAPVDSPCKTPHLKNMIQIFEGFSYTSPSSIINHKDSFEDF